MVVENFSYVFQTSGGGAKSVTREQMRAFKKIWAEFANPRTGYLERSRFVPFFGVRFFLSSTLTPSDYLIEANRSVRSENIPCRVQRPQYHISLQGGIGIGICLAF